MALSERRRRGLRRGWPLWMDFQHEFGASDFPGRVLVTRAINLLLASVAGKLSYSRCRRKKWRRSKGRLSPNPVDPSSANGYFRCGNCQLRRNEISTAFSCSRHIQPVLRRCSYAVWCHPDIFTVRWPCMEYAQ